MSSYREIVTKAVLGKGKKIFNHSHFVNVNNTPSNVLGCWVINHNFKGNKEGSVITVTGSYDINIWYSYDNDTKTQVIKETNNYSEVVHLREREEETTNEEIIVRSLKQPSCVKVDIDGNNINYTIEKELGIELVGDIKMKVEANDDEDPWDEIVEEKQEDEEIDKKIDEVNEEFLQENE